jgi:N-acetylglucosaminyldiphosphoundecaprenol N-acetyl-beta-D-mannosaminyltransferase
MSFLINPMFTTNLIEPGNVVVALTPPPSETVDRVTAPSKCQIWGTGFTPLDMAQTVELAERVIQNGRSEYFITANLNYLMLTEQHPRLAEVNQRCLAVLADGNPIVWRSRFTKTSLPERVAGSDLIVELSRLAADKKYRIFFLGAAPGVAQKAAERLRSQFPNLQIAGCYAPPFRALSRAEHESIIETIRASRADILLVAFGQPKGEFWIYDNLNSLGVPLSIQLGASFDFLAGTARRAPPIWQRIGCEWMYRALSDPRRLAPRYALNIAFLIRKIFQDTVKCCGSPLRWEQN